MTSIHISFQGDSWFDVTSQMREVLGLDKAASLTFDAFPTTEEDEESPVEPAEAIEPEPEPELAPAPAPSKPKKARNLPPPVAHAPPTTRTPEPQPPAKTAARDLPSLDALKASVTAAVRLAQKGEGPKVILDLLPDFKTKTKLDFVMHATDVHRGALADLLEAAGEQVPA